MKNDITLSQLPGCYYTTVSMDLEQVLFLPSLTQSDMFYMSQLSCYKLCVNLVDLGTCAYGMKVKLVTAVMKYSVDFTY